MKQKPQIILILIFMFLIIQLLGILVIHAYAPKTETILNSTTNQLENITIKANLPFGMEPPQEMSAQTSLSSIITSFIIAIILVLLLMKIKAIKFLKLWFFVVVLIALSITINSFILHLKYSQYIALLIALPIAFYKVVKRNIIIHNLSEILIYPGLAAVFVSILNLWSALILLILISVYDIYAVWHSGLMMKMAKFQMNTLKVFGGLLIPFTDKKTKEKIKFLKQKYKNQIPEKVAKKQKLKINVAVLGGGDLAFPLIFTGVVFLTFGLIPALIVTLFSALSLTYLLVFGKKHKPYPAMPYLTAGCLIGLGIVYLLSFI